MVPQQEMVPFSLNDVDMPLKINNSMYAQNTPVFKNVFSLGEIGYCRGYKILTVFLYPVIYVPGSGLIHYIPKMTIKVELEDDAILSDGSNNLYRGSNSDQVVVGDLVENPSELGSYPDEQIPLGGDQLPMSYENGLCDPSENYDIVIITNHSINDTTGYTYNWSDLIDHRLSNDGLTGCIVTVCDIDNCTDYYNATETFNDTQAHIREFIKDAYQDWGISYVILGGDWDTYAAHQMVPYRLFKDADETETYKTMASDMYFSHLDGDWYYSDGSCWGGGKSSGVNDLYGEVYLGRICADDAETVSNAVYKIINYDTNTSLRDTWMNTSTFFGGNLGWVSTGKQYMEEIRLGTDTYRTFTGFEEWNTAYPDNTIDTTERLYHADLGATYETYFSNSIEDDNASIVNHLDHSSITTPLGMSGWDTRYNTKPFFVYSQGCLAGRFHTSDVQGSGCEQLLCEYETRHAYALVLNTGYGYGSYATTNGASQYIQAYFWDYFFNNQSDDMNNWQFGKGIGYAKDKMASAISYSSHAWCYAWYSAHFFGDPSQTFRINVKVETNDAPATSSPVPNNQSTDIAIATNQLTVAINDVDGDTFNWTIETVPNIGTNSSNNDNNGTKTCDVSGLSYSQLYTWYVNATDGNNSINDAFSFTTTAAPVNYSPVISSPSVTNGSSSIAITTSTLSVTIQDSEGDNFNWTIETAPDIGSNSANNETNGSKSCSISGLNFNTTYTWYVNTTDQNGWTNNTYLFTTRTQYAPDAPGNMSIVGSNRFNITLNWGCDDESDSTRLEYNNETDDTWEIGDHDLLYNSTDSSTMHTGLNPDQTVYYKLWSYNVTDDVWSYNSTGSASTQSNNLAVLSNPNPSNGSSNQDLSLVWNVTIIDSDDDTFNWTIECSNGQSNSDDNDTDGSKQITITGLSYSSTYNLWVNVTDPYSTTYETYSFTVRDQYIPEIPGSFTATSVSRFQISLSWVKATNADYTYIEYNTTLSTWSKGQGTELYNSTGTSTIHPNLTPNQSMYYCAWSYNSTDNIWNNTNSNSTNTTDQNNPVTYGAISINNESINQDINLNWTIVLQDSDGDTFNWTIECNNSQNSNANNENNGTKTLELTNLSYNTAYTIWVNTTDNYSSSDNFYIFTTRYNDSFNQAVNCSNQNPTNSSTSVSIDLDTINITLEDPDGDTFNWTIQTSPDVGNSSGVLATNGSKNCSISGLSYSQTYTWYVNSTDGSNTTNETYVFTVENQPYTPPPVGGGGTNMVVLPNNDPTADSGGPYVGNVSENITFDGSGSNDSDGTIAEYSWDFGDGTTGSGVETTYIYTEEGVYNVTLTVTDDDDATNSEITTATVSIIAVDNSSDPAENNSEVESDADEDGILDEIEDQIGTDTDETNIFADLTINGFDHIIVDTDGDNRFDIFYNLETGKDTILEFIDDTTVLIDEDGDGNFDYVYDITTSSYSAYATLSQETPNKNESKFYLILLIIIILILCIFVLLRDKISLALLNYKLKRLKNIDDHQTVNNKTEAILDKSQQVHFFSKTDDEEPPVNHMDELDEEEPVNVTEDISIEEEMASSEDSEFVPTGTSLETFMKRDMQLTLKPEEVSRGLATVEDVELFVDRLIFGKKKTEYGYDRDVVKKNVKVNNIEDEIDEILRLRLRNKN